MILGILIMLTICKMVFWLTMRFSGVDKVLAWKNILIHTIQFHTLGTCFIWNILLSKLSARSLDKLGDVLFTVPQNWLLFTLFITQVLHRWLPLVILYFCIYMCRWIGWQGGSALAPDYWDEKGWVFSRWKTHNVSIIDQDISAHTIPFFDREQVYVVSDVFLSSAYLLTYALKKDENDLQKNWSDEFTGKCWVLSLKSLLCSTTREGIDAWWWCVDLVFNIALLINFVVDF